jgi:hypothetical protein
MGCGQNDRKGGRKKMSHSFAQVAHIGVMQELSFWLVSFFLN